MVEGKGSFLVENWGKLTIEVLVLQDMADFVDGQNGTASPRKLATKYSRKIIALFDYLLVCQPRLPTVYAHGSRPKVWLKLSEALIYSNHRPLLTLILGSKDYKLQ